MRDSRKSKDELRQAVEQHTAEFLRKGGTITQLDRSASAYRDNVSWERDRLRGKIKVETTNDAR